MAEMSRRAATFPDLNIRVARLVAGGDEREVELQRCSTLELQNSRRLTAKGDLRASVGG
jgi:hypothetical protein